uniref:NAD(P)-binding domain-containing protein n=1 Tax=Odontella aurita TaxID=265563 RepID=A0A7S4K4R0_9STRA|mmetsp:Transcript_61543/g.181871  ORF Transcript_61543/g.181871 Transcript_61543/m.181871 type:complete len:272 (+) Transcript_61543:213-1028(+)|eukprot:CAMPEP_0113559376 /NCGR_PEP_ID=MMETSP0015_2-20120614/18865_1 /TAXON_ID=2838 /ORGANISM="Odontella" /LENGTH=271 /DNA_ID=CAMNT_0000461011 /DNA_START=212 /DNA_END=1027 /DNA_ORIENTATION=+ /assembly_acc=CAM_ASM_000160
MSNQVTDKVAVVLGARGGTGKQLVHRLSENPAFKKIRAVVRDASAVDPASIFPADDRIETLSGDVTKPDSLRAAFEGATHIFNVTSGSHSRSAEVVAAVDRDGVGATAALAAEVCGSGLERYLLVSSQLVHNSNKWNPIRVMLNNMATGPFASKGLMDLKWEGEEKLRHCDPCVPYTIVRPGRLGDGPLGSTSVIVGQTNANYDSGNATTRADLAAACVAAALAENTLNTTFELSTAKAESSDSVAEGKTLPVPEDIFSDLKPRYLENHTS